MTVLNYICGLYIFLQLSICSNLCKYTTRNNYKRQGSRPSPRKKKCKKAKWLSGEDLQIAVKRREVKSKGEKVRYKHLNAEFQRIARRDKKALNRGKQ